MKQFFIKIKYVVYDHFSAFKILYIFLTITAVASFVLGIYASKNNINLNILGIDNENYYNFVVGSHSFSDVFNYNFKNILVALIVLFVINLSVYSSFLSFVFLAYQSFIYAGTLVALSALSNAVIPIILMVITNTILICVFIFMSGVFIHRAQVAKKFKYKIIESCTSNGFEILIPLIVLVCFLYCIFCSVIIPLSVKSFIFVTY